MKVLNAANCAKVQAAATMLPPITPMPQPVPNKCLPLLLPVTYRAAASQLVSAVAAERAAIVARRSTELYAAFITANDVLTRLA